MRRREAMALLGGALAWPVLARAETVRRISILHSGFPRRTPINVLYDALRALGYQDGKTAAIELLGGEGDQSRLNSLVAHLAAARPEVIVALTDPAALALKNARVTTPVVFVFVTDPIVLGIIESNAHPGGNFTGVTYSDSGLGGKRLELLLDAFPGIKRVAVIWNPSFRMMNATLGVIREASRARGVEIVARELTDPGDLARAFADVKASGAEAVIFMSDNAMFGRRKEVAAAALANRLPSIHSFSPEAEDGGLMSFGPDLDESYRRAAALVDSILRGARPSELPVEEPTHFMLCVNMKTAAALSVTIPASILVRADRVIE